MRFPEYDFEIEYGGEKSPWILSMYIVAEVAILPLAGKCIDVHGPRKVLLAAIPVFIIGAVVCIFSNGIDMLIVARAVQGIGAGMAFAVCLAYIGIFYPRSKRGKPHELMTAAFAFGSLYVP